MLAIYLLYSAPLVAAVLIAILILKLAFLTVIKERRTEALAREELEKFLTLTQREEARQLQRVTIKGVYGIYMFQLCFRGVVRFIPHEVLPSGKYHTLDTQIECKIFLSQDVQGIPWSEAIVHFLLFIQAGKELELFREGIVSVLDTE